MGLQTYRISVKGIFFQQRTVTNWYYSLQGSPNASVLLALANAWRTHNAGAGLSMMSHFQNCMTSDWGCNEITYTRVTEDAAATTQLIQANLALAGTLAPPTAPPQVAAVIRRLTNIATRWGRGRIFTPAVQQGSVANGVIQPAAGANSLDTQLSFFASIIGSAIQGNDGGAAVNTYIPVLLRTKLIDIPGGKKKRVYVWDNVGDPEVTRILAGGYDRVTRAQRRREIGVGV